MSCLFLELTVPNAYFAASGRPVHLGLNGLNSQAVKKAILTINILMYSYLGSLYKLLIKPYPQFIKISYSTSNPLIKIPYLTQKHQITEIQVQQTY